MKPLLMFAAGVLTGGACTAAYFKVNYIKISVHEKEIKDMTRYNEKRMSAFARRSRVRHNPVPYTSQQGPDIQDDNQKYEKPEYVEYDKRFKQAEQDAPEATDGDNYQENYSQGEAVRKDRESAKAKGPKLIKAEDFGSESYLDAVTLLYYVDDGVLTSEDEEVYEDLDEVEDMLGDALRKFGFDQNDEPTIYVRNYDRACDYEIIKVFSSYNDT